MSQSAQSVRGPSAGRSSSPLGRPLGRLSQAGPARPTTSHTSPTSHGTRRNAPWPGWSFRRSGDRSSSPEPAPPGRFGLRSSDLRSEVVLTLTLVLLALALILLIPAASPADTLDALVVTSAVADLGTTEWALRQPGLREGNPLMSEPAIRYAGKAVGTAAVLGGSRYLERHGHRGWSRAVRIGAVVVWGGLAVHNAMQTRRAR